MLAFFVTLFTGIGGHYINRRWDRAVLFLCLFILYVCGVWAFTFILSSTPDPNGDFGQILLKRLHLMTLIMSMGILSLWILSLIVTYMDSRSANPPTLTIWTKSGIGAAIFTTAMSTLIITYSLMILYSYNDSHPDVEVGHWSSDDGDTPSFSWNDNFYEFLYLGGEPSSFNELPKPPSGDGALLGRVVYDGKPATGVSLVLVLNSSYRTAEMTTDDQGMFTLALPPETWHINSVRTRLWTGKPPISSCSLFYGGEKKLSGDSYHEGFNPDNPGYTVHVTVQKPEDPHIEITIKPDIELVWPKSPDRPVESTINDTIRWEAYPGARIYCLEITKVEHSGSTATFFPISSTRIQDRTSLPLKDLPHAVTKSKKPREYSVTIRAFSEDGTLVGKNDKMLSEQSFLLKDGVMIIEDQYTPFIDPDPEKTEAAMESVAFNTKRASAIEILIEDGMVDEALNLVDMMDSEYAHGKKEALAGYIFSLKGECQKGRELFDQARSIHPDICIPRSYHVQCPD